MHASDNTDYRLLFGNGIICVENELGHCVCEFYADDAPAVDAVEVVRCKDCKYYCNGWHCNLYLNVSHETKPDHFCSYGERRDNERTD